MKVYIAGKLGTDEEKEIVGKVEKLCKNLGLETFVPHRDVGIAGGIWDVKRVFKGDINDGLDSCDALIAVLDGLHVGAGTAWEIGYAYAQGMPCIGIKTDESVEEGFEYLSPIIIGSVDMATSFSELNGKLKELIENFLNPN